MRRNETQILSERNAGRTSRRKTVLTRCRPYIVVEYSHGMPMKPAIPTPTQQQRRIRENYRSWLEGSILKKSDDSIVGTWLDPAFDKIESEPSFSDKA